MPTTLDVKALYRHKNVVIVGLLVILVIFFIFITDSKTPSKMYFPNRFQFERKGGNISDNQTMLFTDILGNVLECQGIWYPNSNMVLDEVCSAQVRTMQVKMIRLQHQQETITIWLRN